MGLTKEQYNTMTSVLDDIDEGVKRIVLKGSAGTGKTWLMKELIVEFKRRKYRHGNVFVTAPTHKALSVLKAKIGSEKEFREFGKPENNIGKYIVYNTIHKALKLKRKINNKTGQITFPQEINPKYPPFKDCLLLVIDEASMIEPQLITYLEQYDFPILFVGDDKQLNPVGFRESPVFTQDWATYELTEIIRQGLGNPIIDLSRNLDWMRSGEDNMIDDLGYFFFRNRQKIVDKLAEVNGTDELKYLAYTNQEVNKINKEVREKIYGRPGVVESGESIVLNSPIGDHYTNKEIKVEHVEIIDKVFYIDENKRMSVELKVYLVNGELPIVHEESKDLFNKTISVIKTQIAAHQLGWRDFFAFSEQFADFTYNHGITVHKSQGSTYKEAIVNVPNLNMNRNAEEKRRLKYTAVTRPSDTLILYYS